MSRHAMASIVVWSFMNSEVLVCIYGGLGISVVVEAVVLVSVNQFADQ